MANVLNGRILKLALPNILSNLTIPLLGMVDLALSGHLRDAYAIGGIAIASTLFSLIYWNFSFLRMGTTGLTAQAHGRGDKIEMGRNLMQSLFIAITSSVLVLSLQYPLLGVILSIMSPEPALISYATTYYNIVIWGAPAMLCTYALNGWLIGMQNTWCPMVVSIVTNITNIVISASLVLIWGRGIEGIAIGTLSAQWIGVIALGIGVYYLFLKRGAVHLPNRFRDLKIGLRRYFGTNIHIFFRTMLLALISAFFTYSGTQQGVLTLAANALLYQFFNFFSYFIDGFAFAAEALVGHFYGMKERQLLRSSIRTLIVWGFGIAVATSLVYMLVSSPFLHILTDKEEVIVYAQNYLPWVFIIPFTGFLAFLFDGVFVGVTATKEMFVSMFIAVLVFFALYYLLPLSDQNHILWASFVTYLAIRGSMQVLIARRLKGIGLPFEYIYYLSIGSTFLDREPEIRRQITKKFPKGEFSSFYSTPDASGKSDKVYLNSVFRIESELSLEEVIACAKRMEEDAGRDRSSQEVTLDVDVVMQDAHVLRERDFRHDYFQYGYKELITYEQAND